MKGNVTKGILVAVLVTLVISLFYAAYLMGNRASEKARRPKPLRPQQIERIKKRLNLSDVEFQTLHDMKEENERKLKNKSRQLRENRLRMLSEFRKEEMDLKRIQQLHEEQKALQMEFSDIKFYGMLEMKKSLTPEQFKNVMRFMHRKQKRMKGVLR